MTTQPRLTNFQIFPASDKWRWRVSVCIDNRLFSDVEGWGNTFQEAHTMAWDEAMKYDTDDLPGRERREQAARYYQQGKLFPYDGPAVGAGDWAIRAARGVLAALKHKRLVLDGYEEAQRVETVQLLAEIIRHAASENGITE